ncbi:Hypothetical protein EAG7_00753 [Klebsiella aerogenes]|nr:Hypothetical protein EAG7_00753 [Klebsiella aerogenes]CCG29309.1 hypothetical protein [Klebsiella aerogenes EA1509E]
MLRDVKGEYVFFDRSLVNSAVAVILLLFKRKFERIQRDEKLKLWK